MLEETARLCCALRRLIAAVPADLETGIRLCCGERDGHSFLEQLDSGKAMRFPTLDVERIDRPLNWVHVPVPIGGEDDAHDTPSRVLRLPDGAEPYLRVVHAADGLQVRPTSRSPARVAIGGGKASATDCVQERGCRALCSEVRHRRGMRFARARRPDVVKQFLETHAGAAAL